MRPESAHSSLRGSTFLVGVDVGTRSVRAGVFGLDGGMISTAKHDITLFRAPGSIVEQSSSEIWNAVCKAVKESVSQAAISPGQIAGVGFDATCSLVVLGEGGRPLPVGSSEEVDRNIIVWMDHRALEQAERINNLGHDVLKFVGGKISPEMETPKLLWLLENRPEVFNAAWQFFDLADFLTWRATSDLSRSICTVTCKWTYLAHERRWDAGYFRRIGLGILADEEFSRIGPIVQNPGTPLGKGLTEHAAQELGLLKGTPVAAGMIDAHAGGIGTVGSDGNPESCLAYVFGTSSCTMTTTRTPVFVPGVWGPYFSAMIPHTWLNEGGQSVAGAAIDQLLLMHPATPDLRRRAKEEGQTLPEMLASLAVQDGREFSDAVLRAEGLHIVPDFLGNRAPLADPHARAVIAGLGMSTDEESLVALYVAGLCSIAYGLRQIIEAQSASGAPIERIVISGGAGRLDLVRHLLADAIRKPVLATQAEEPVLLGAAILGGVAAGAFDDVPSAMKCMSHVRNTYHPVQGPLASLHEKRFSAFLKLQRLAKEIR